MSSAALPLAALAFASWAIYLGGLAALQAQCYDVNSPGDTHHLGGVVGFSAGLLSCSKVYRFYWFIMSFEFVVVVGLGYAVASGKLAQMKTSFLGLFAIATLLYIQACNAFLTAQSVDFFDTKNTDQLHRIRTTVAGAICTAVVNAALVFALGLKEESAAPAEKPAEKETAAAAV